jgi:hypothetical protein
MDPSGEGVTSTIDADIPCVSCGYNLRGLRGTRCPECGSEIAPSLAAYEISRRMPGLAALPGSTLRELRRGACLVLLAWAIQVAVPWYDHLTGYGSVPAVYRRTQLYLICAAWTMEFWGLWMLAMPLAWVGKSARPPRRPWWIAGIILLAALTPGWIFFDYAMYRWRGWYPPLLSDVMTLAAMVASAACIALCQVYAARCAALARRTWLAGAAWTLAVLHGLAYVGWVLVVGHGMGHRSLDTLTILPGPLGSPIVGYELPYRLDYWRQQIDNHALLLLGYALLQLASAFVLAATALLLFRTRTSSGSHEQTKTPASV